MVSSFGQMAGAMRVPGSTGSSTASGFTTRPRARLSKASGARESASAGLVWCNNPREAIRATRQSESHL
jgi:hypothetical protein